MSGAGIGNISRAGSSIAVKDVQIDLAYNFTDRKIIETLVRVARVELASQPWEGHVLPLYYTRTLWSHLGDSNSRPPLYESDALAN